MTSNIYFYKGIERKRDRRLSTMAAGLAGMAFIPYYNHLIQLLETNEELKKTGKGRMCFVWYFRIFKEGNFHLKKRNTCNTFSRAVFLRIGPIPNIPKIPITYRHCLL